MWNVWVPERHYTQVPAACHTTKQGKSVKIIVGTVLEKRNRFTRISDTAVF